MSTGSEFYVYLLSNASMGLHPSNTLSQFTVTLDKPLQLNGEYEVGLQELTLPNSFYNVTQSPSDNVIKLSYLDVNEAEKSVEAELDIESALQMMFQEYDIGMHYEDFRYVFTLPDKVDSVKLLGKELQHAIGITVINRNTLQGGMVSPAINPIRLSEEKATAMRLRHPITINTGFGEIILDSRTSSIKAAFEDYFSRTVGDPGKIEYKNNTYSLTVSKDFPLPADFLDCIRVKDIREEGEFKYVSCYPITKTYRVIITSKTPTSIQVSLPPDYYDTPILLLDTINKRLQGKAKFVYNTWNRKCSLTLDKDVVSVELSEYYSYLLGFSPTTTFSENTTAKEEIIIEPPISNIMVYTDIVENSIVGDTRLPIFKMARFAYDGSKQKLSFAFKTIQYFKVTQREIASIAIKLFTDTGRKLPLRNRGRTALTLHFGYVR